MTLEDRIERITNKIVAFMLTSTRKKDRLEADKLIRPHIREILEEELQGLETRH